MYEHFIIRFVLFVSCLKSSCQHEGHRNILQYIFEFFHDSVFNLTKINQVINNYSSFIYEGYIFLNSERCCRNRLGVRDSLSEPQKLENDWNDDLHSPRHGP